MGTALAPVRLHTVPSVKSARLAHHVHPSPATEQRPPPPSGPLPRDLRVPVVKDDWRGLCRGTGPPHGAVSRWGHGPRGAARGHSSLPLLQAPSGVTGSHPEPGRRREPAASPAIPEESGSRVLGGLAQGWWPAPRGTWDWAHTSFKGPVCSTPRGTSWSWSAPCCGDQEGLGLPLTLNPHTAPQPCSAPRKDLGTEEAPAGLQGGGAGTWRLLEEPSSGPRALALLGPAQDPALCLGLGAAPLGLHRHVEGRGAQASGSSPSRTPCQASAAPRGVTSAASAMGSEGGALALRPHPRLLLQPPATPPHPPVADGTVWGAASAPSAQPLGDLGPST